MQFEESRCDNKNKLKSKNCKIIVCCFLSSSLICDLSNSLSSNYRTFLDTLSSFETKSLFTPANAIAFPVVTLDN